MEEFLPIAQIVVAVLLIIFILLQQRGTALGSAFGGGGGGFYATRRGIQKKVFWATVVLGALFVILALLNLIF
jgi:protein translocase SecG subunit